MNDFNPYQAHRELLERMNLNGTVVIGVSHVANDEFSWTTNDTVNGGIIFHGGIRVEMYRYLQDALNFTEKGMIATFVKTLPDGRLGGGMAELINNCTAHVSIGHNAITKERMSGPDALAFIHSTDNFRTIAIFKQRANFNIAHLYKILDMKSWIAIFLLFFAFALIMICIRKIDTFIKGAIEPLNGSEFILALGVTCKQGNISFGPSEYSNIPGNFITFTVNTSAIIIHVFITCTLLSNLTSTQGGITSFKELISSDFHIFMDNTIIFIPYFYEVVVQPTMIEMDKKFLANIIGHDNDRNAVITFPIGGDPYIKDMLCSKFSYVYSGATRQFGAMFVKKSSHLRELFNIKTLQMNERGITWRIIRYHITYLDTPCVKNLNNNRAFFSIGMEHLGQAVLAYVVYISFSVSILCVEYFLIRPNLSKSL